MGKKILIEFEDTPLAKNILGRLNQWGYGVNVDRVEIGDGSCTNVYKVTEK